MNSNTHIYSVYSIYITYICIIHICVCPAAGGGGQRAHPRGDPSARERLHGRGHGGGLVEIPSLEMAGVEEDWGVADPMVHEGVERWGGGGQLVSPGVVWMGPA